MLAVFMAFGSAACGDKGSNDDTGDTDTDTGTPPPPYNSSGCDNAIGFPWNHQAVRGVQGDVCEIRLRRPSSCGTKVYGVMLSGSTVSPGEQPVRAKVMPPGACGSSGLQWESTVTSGIKWLLDYADHSFCPVAANDTAAVTCNSAIQAADGDWVITLPMHSSEDCADYGEVGLTFYSEGSAGCTPPTNPPSPSCTADANVEFDLIHRRWADLDGDGTEHGILVPVLKSGGDFSERAWITKIEVTDWGDAESLHVVKTGSQLVLDGDSVVGGDIETFTPLDDTKTFSRGLLHMGTVFALDGLPADQTFQAPKVKMTWACNVNVSDPHYTVVSRPQAYGRRLDTLGLTGVTHDHQLLLRIYEADSYATLELQGRHWDAMSIPLTASGSDWTFDFEDPQRGLKASGAILPEGIHKVVTFTELTVGQLDLGTPSWTMLQFDES